MTANAIAVDRTISASEAESILKKLMLPALQMEHALTKNVIAAIPLDKGDYRPHAVVKTALELAWHIAASENRFLDAVAAGKFNFDGSARPESVRNSADVVAWYAESFARNIQRLQQLSPEQLTKPIDFRGIFQFPAVLYLQIGLNHSIHHRGQLSTYLRPMGAKVPSIYGESYDAAEERKAKQAATAIPA